MRPAFSSSGVGGGGGLISKLEVLPFLILTAKCSLCKRDPVLWQRSPWMVLYQGSPSAGSACVPSPSIIPIPDSRSLGPASHVTASSYQAKQVLKEGDSS